MRTIIQRVTQASVEIADQVKGSIGPGLLVLLGIEEGDSEEDAAWLAAKIVNMRIFGDADGLMNLSVQAVNGDILLVSQFTLHAQIKKGNRPSFIRAARPEKAIPLYERFIALLETQLGKKVQTGEFGAYMKVNLLNDGPVTIFIDTKNKE
ncbi:D-tyrosyl-tRNA(Tyr) deacylase [Anseongella ginsenosidimutans]|uniref:D-aminoacyl-tRNA deacylase n=1 Tax=Anseongella ginsenosidimutans TaxID=496056 RepID=A0A4R3KPT5_9SPHI|nr:D-aminoacyl-tRNA deacylase [Anseongella ginsenosidimutans]QEC52218.1 D-tyrosyl-tRNA(Tyr) deacylase [Anseongella ginsenosidimutans]TCS86768.1 D-tyrosyl-tRNA(Tyr) deacylase [Anseongella ginsenosidimutans]